MANSKSKDQEIKVEPGADARLANILKRALNTAPKSAQERRDKKPRKSSK